MAWRASELIRKAICRHARLPLRTTPMSAHSTKPKWRLVPMHSRFLMSGHMEERFTLAVADAAISVAKT